MKRRKRDITPPNWRTSKSREEKERDEGVEEEGVEEEEGGEVRVGQRKRERKKREKNSLAAWRPNFLSIFRQMEDMHRRRTGGRRGKERERRERR